MESASAWQSVLCWGNAEHVTDAKSIQRIKLVFGEQHGQILLKEGKMPVDPFIKDLQQHAIQNSDESVLYRIKPYRMTGKAEK